MIGFLFAFLTVAAVSVDDAEYLPSPQQQRVDQSFSDIPIDAPLAELKHRLSMIVENECEQREECEWRDAQGVRYYFFGDGPDNLGVAVKSIDAADYPARAIPALGIGVARERDEVLTAARKFVPDANFECGELDDDSIEVCNATLEPGWLTIRFDASGSLMRVQLDGYHFT